VIWIALIPAVWALVGAGVLWGWNRFLASVPDVDEPVPYWPAAGPCTWCKPVPEGMCTCTSVCGHSRCIGDHTSMAVFSDEDWGELQRLLREGHE
jgi:hypothetical protein